MGDADSSAGVPRTITTTRRTSNKSKPQSPDPTSESSAPTNKKLRSWWPLLVLPYLVGIIWHGLHPVVSIFTGHAHPRGWYIDESSLDPTHFRLDTHKHYTAFKPNLVRELTTNDDEQCASSFSLCQQQLDAVPGQHSRNIQCHQHADQFTLTRILPVSNAVAPVSEALVLVVPFAANGNYNATAFHFSFVQLLQRLATAPWLAKTILVVSPTNATTSLDECVDLFLDTYLGANKGHRRSVSSFSSNAIPESWKGALLRQLIVLDTNSTALNNSQKGSTRTLEILTQGHTGVLPNMDFVVLVQRVLSRCRFLQANNKNSKIVSGITMHPYADETTDGQLWIREMLPTKWHAWANSMLELLLFEHGLWWGPAAPHAAALDRGVDSLTIRLQLQGESEATQASHISDMIQKMEGVVRGLSNLHERLHHSTSLYLFPGPSKFVKHEEYLVPNLLLVIPLVIRAVTLILFDIKRFDFFAVKRAVVVMLGVTLAFSWVASLFASYGGLGGYLAMAIPLSFIYCPVFIPESFQPPHTPQGMQSIQFVACLLAVYIHVPIAFGHVSLAMPSALLWTPLLAFPCYRTDTISFARSCLTSFVPILMHPVLFNRNTAWFKYAYLPLHCLLVFLYRPFDIAIVEKDQRFRRLDER